MCAYHGHSKLLLRYNLRQNQQNDQQSFSFHGFCPHNCWSLLECITVNNIYTSICNEKLNCKTFKQFHVFHRESCKFSSMLLLTNHMHTDAAKQTLLTMSELSNSWMYKKKPIWNTGGSTCTIHYIDHVGLAWFCPTPTLSTHDTLNI